MDTADAAPGKLPVEIIEDPEQGGFTAHIPNIPVYGEGETEEEAIADLKEGLIGYMETYGLEDALQRVSSPIFIRHIDLDLSSLSSD